MSAGLTSRLDALRAALGEIAPVISGGVKRVVIFLSATDGTSRATVRTVTGADVDDAWQRAGEVLQSGDFAGARWLRIEWVDAVERSSWGALRARLIDTKRNYFRLGIALDADFEHAFLETELNANAMLYGGPHEPAATLNEGNFGLYAASRHGLGELSFADDRRIWLFTTRGAFVGEDDVVHEFRGTGLDAGRRALPPLDAEQILGLIERGSGYLATQVGADGKFTYGWHPCFDRPIAAYNSLRHASTVYAMLEAWEVTRDDKLKEAIDRALAYLTKELIQTGLLPKGGTGAFLVDCGGEIKLGGNAVAILALVKYRQLTGDHRHQALCDGLAQTILSMQDPVSGRFDHVLNYPALDVKQSFRTIYYDGEAAFALMRLFDLTGERRWLDAVERAFEHFIREEHWKAHDHWLSYCVNELTQHNPSETYYRFGVDNVRDYLDFVLERVTTFPTLLELMTAAEKMIGRLRSDPALAHLLERFDLPRFYQALHFRANYLLNGHFWPELAMFFARPDRIVGSFFIRHHGFRVRIDDVEHYLSGLIAYRNLLIDSEAGGHASPAEREQMPANVHWTAEDVVRATAGHWSPQPLADWSASGLCIAPMTMSAGDMVAVRLREGEVGVGAQWLGKLAHRPAALIAAGRSEEMPVDCPLLEVEDVSASILALGRYARSRMTGKILAVTGSAGKTTAVAMLARALEPFGAVGQTRHNANLPHGIAWNLASIPWNVPHVVLELAIGRMARNARLTRPDIAIFTNILPAHLEYHRDLATVATRKSAIFEGMTAGGAAILNRDMAEWERVHMAAKQRGLEIVHYGRSPDCHFRLLDYDAAENRVRASIFGKECDYSLGAAGEHMALNSLAVLAAVATAGHDLDPAIAVLAGFSAVAGRGERSILHLGTRRITLIDEGYNANPGSMASALALLGGWQGPGRKIVVLGEMRELGEASATYHTDLAPLVVANGVDRVYAVGDLYDEFWRALPAELRGSRANTPDELKQPLLDELRDGDVLLLKGSHGSLIHELVDWLKGVAGLPINSAEGRNAATGEGGHGDGGSGKPTQAVPTVRGHGSPTSERYSLGALRTVASMSQAAAKATAGAGSELLEGARQLLQARLKMARLVPKGLLRDSAWDMMLELYISGEEGGISYVKQLILTSGESPAAAMRRIDRLEEAGFIERFIDPLDRRRVIVRLTGRGHAAMFAMLEHVFEKAEHERWAREISNLR
jgi:UDP-N-acetylmuramoyl-tripeptide--D-alanyl-D-alanine ligase